MLRDDILYYRHRAEVETELAEKAQDPGAVAAHYQLATLYFERAEGREKRDLTSRD
jgi:hypothetical protein